MHESFRTLHGIFRRFTGKIVGMASHGKIQERRVRGGEILIIEPFLYLSIWDRA